MSPIYPIVERHLFPQYRDVLSRIALPPALGVLDLATGTGLLAGAFAERGHAVTGLDFAHKLLNRARKRFPKADFRNLDLRHLDRIETGAYDLVSMGYFLHGLSPGFRRSILRESGQGRPSSRPYPRLWPRRGLVHPLHRVARRAELSGIHSARTGSGS